MGANQNQTDLNSSDDEPCDNELDEGCETYGLEEISDGDDDEELQQARSNLKLKKTTSKRTGIDGVADALRELHKVTLGGTKNSNKDSEPFDHENDASGDDDYESDKESEPPQKPKGKVDKASEVKHCSVCNATDHNKSKCPKLGKGKSKRIVGSGLYIDEVTGRQTINPGTSGEYVVVEGSRSEIGWGAGRRPTTSSELFLQQRASGTSSVPPPVFQYQAMPRPPKSKTNTKSKAKARATAHQSQPIQSKVPSAEAPPPHSSQPCTNTITKSLAPLPLPKVHAGFQRSGVLCIPGRQDWVTASQIKMKGKAGSSGGKK
ncbi:hypothetical protein ACFE04_026138 [Oxalis oulophora]